MTKRILIVEDNPLLAMDVAVIIEDAGYEVIGPCVSVASALAAIADGPPDAALLDLNLGDDENSLPVAMKLHELGLPYLIVSGYAAQWIPDEMSAAPHVAKPFDESELLGGVAALL